MSKEELFFLVVFNKKKESANSGKSPQLAFSFTPFCSIVLFQILVV
jgi:hypothetical protein